MQKKTMLFGLILLWVENINYSNNTSRAMNVTLHTIVDKLFCIHIFNSTCYVFDFETALSVFKQQIYTKQLQVGSSTGQIPCVLVQSQSKEISTY